MDVFEITGIPTSAPITVRIARDQLLSLSLNTNAVSVNGRTVQNSDWTLNAMDPSVYVLTTTRSIAGGDKLSFGLEGTLTPGNTSGTLTVSCLIVGGSSGEVVVSNNTSANKIDYFQQ